jgi:hypothetical protein
METRSVIPPGRIKRPISRLPRDTYRPRHQRAPDIYTGEAHPDRRARGKELAEDQRGSGEVCLVGRFVGEQSPPLRLQSQRCRFAALRCARRAVEIPRGIQRLGAP